jgi:hypothetical protein
VFVLVGGVKFKIKLDEAVTYQLTDLYVCQLDSWEKMFSIGQCLIEDCKVFKFKCLCLCFQSCVNLLILPAIFVVKSEKYECKKHILNLDCINCSCFSRFD